MMVAGIVAAAGISGALLDPYSPQRLALVASGVVATALLVTILALWQLERQAMPVTASADAAEVPDMREALAEIIGEQSARRFTLFIFVSMLAYSMQDLILEPFAGLVFGMTPGQSTQLSGMQHGGVLLGMVVSGVGGSAFAGRLPGELRSWIGLGCIGSALALAGLAFGSRYGVGWPLAPNVFLLGFFNGMFAVAAIGAMMGLAGAGERTREGVRMGVWGAAQAIAFGLGGLTGALGVDLARRLLGHDATAFQLIFSLEGGLFVAAAWLAFRMSDRPARSQVRVAES
jgi:BCD family chlorophyll transporter-like MFS transporter